MISAYTKTPTGRSDRKPDSAASDPILERPDLTPWHFTRDSMRNILHLAASPRLLVAIFPPPSSMCFVSPAIDTRQPCKCHLTWHSGFFGLNTPPLRLAPTSTSSILVALGSSRSSCILHLAPCFLVSSPTVALLHLWLARMDAEAVLERRNRLRQSLVTHPNSSDLISSHLISSSPVSLSLSLFPLFSSSLSLSLFSLVSRPT